MAYESHLYNRRDPSDGLGADVLSPGQENDGTESKKTVDIYRNYNWTLSNNIVRDYIPYIELTEYKQILSSEISGFFYGLAGAVDNVRVGIRTAGTSVAGLGDITGSNLNRAANTGDGIYKGLDDELKEGLIKLNEFKAKAGAATGLSQSQPYDRNLIAYTGLYALEETGWSYTMPFLTSSNMMTPSNVWGSPGSKAGSAVGDILGAFKPAAPVTPPGTAGITAPAAAAGMDVFSLLKGLSNLPLAATAGAILPEEPKSFTGTNEDEVTVVYYLYNTQEYSDIRKNWEFCYLFTYQNLANRKGVNLLDPPCLYKVLIPGYKQLPLCWVSDLKVENKGAVRMIDIRTGEDAKGASHAYIKMIPEAYKITITLKSVLMNARNIFTYAEDPTKRVTVSTSGV